MGEQAIALDRQYPDYDSAVNYWRGVARGGITGAALYEGPPAVIEGSLVRQYGHSAIAAEGISEAARRTVAQEGIQFSPDPEARIPPHLLTDYLE